ncbi:MAG: PQQ-binding-like beta-propeller repeat protein, partial [Candidatus Dormibacteraeota bacterium]|nr:PQQ-binding-like beta-propeller repeat protein [Candidatus Dormibacteraeota bacterium]
GNSPSSGASPDKSVAASGPLSPGPGGFGTEWTSYQGGALHGVLPGGGSFQGARREGWTSPQLDEAVWAAPIVAGGQVIVATENNTVYAFDAHGSGDWKPRWIRHLAAPVPAGDLPCGDVSPVAGIISTPVADVAAQRLYVVAFQQPNHHHVLYTLNLGTGKVLKQVTVDPPGESTVAEQQRGALRLANGYVYVPYGGLDGDCSQYHGWVMAAPTGGGDVLSFRPPVCPNGCPFWEPGGPTIGPDGDLWVTSGNSDGTPSAGPFDYSNAVFRLSPQLKLKDWFAPQDWRSQSQQDLDLGDISPVLLPGGLLVQVGKNGTAYLLRQDQLGKMGGAAGTGQACGAWSAAVADGNRLYVPCWRPTGQVMALDVNPAGPSIASVAQRTIGLPGGLIVAYGAVWVMDPDAGRLEALDPANLNVRFSTGGGGVQHFQTAAAGNGHVFAVLGGRLVAVAA